MKKKNSALGEIRTHALWLPPALLSHHLAVAVPRIWIINKVKFCNFNVDIWKEFTSELWIEQGSERMSE